MQYRLLYELAKSLHEQNLQIHPTLQTLLAKTGLAIGAANGCLMTFRDSGEIDHVYVLGAEESPAMRNREMWTTLLTRGLVGYVYHSDRVMVIRNIQTDPRWPAQYMSSSAFRAGSAVGVPIAQGNDLFAVMVFVHPEIDYFGDEALAILDEVASVSSHALGNIRMVLRHQEAVYDTRYHAIFEHTPVPVILTDDRSLIVDANLKACDFLGFQRVVLRGIPLQDVNIVTQVAIEHIGAEEMHFPTNIYDIDGNSIPTLIRARRIELNGNSYVEWVLQDMSVQMELEQLRHDLTAMVYHDLRGPLGSIHMAINKLAELLHGHENPAILKILQLGLRSTQQVSRLVEGLLDIQRLESGSTILDRQPAEIETIMTDAMQLVIPHAEQSEVDIQMDFSNVPLVNVDTDMIKRVVINLMENAIKYTPSGSKITLRTIKADGLIRAVVSDTGPGIPKDMLSKIFDKFSRVKYTGPTKGVGLGLAFCRLAVEAHGGKIWVESDGENGSDFIFTLPVYTPESEIETAELSSTDQYATTA